MDSFEIERYELIKEKMEYVLNDESIVKDSYGVFFDTQMRFLLSAMEMYERMADGDNTLTPGELIEYNKKLYETIIVSNYDCSFCNPTYAVQLLGEGVGRIFSVVAYEMRAVIPAIYEKDGVEILYRAELLMEIYGNIKDAFEEQREPDPNELKEIIYWYVSDYYDIQNCKRVKEMVKPEQGVGYSIVMNENLETPDYLYRYGEYITDNEIKMSEYMASLPKEKILKIAKTFTEGYRIGFINTGKDLSKKETVNIRYPLGMERVVRESILLFEQMGLKPVIYRACSSLFRRQNMNKVGYFGANPNKQYDYDHDQDEALILDGQLVTRKIECLKNAFEENKQQANRHAGPAVIELFGEEPFLPKEKKERIKLNKMQQQLSVKQAMQSGMITNEYIKGEERSFTIIAFPGKAIGDRFEEIFDETLEINTLDYYIYRDLQQKIIDELDKGEKVYIEGKGTNTTRLSISLVDVEDSASQTKFENCVADVNIPVGEVFTSPRLKGTNGVLNVSRVFLNELEYINLKVVFEEGMVKEYSCDNYEDAEKNRSFFKENVLFNHDTLPIGEFAIGTNTRAYKFGRTFGIEGRLPILIAEKTGPHFALGDTCYSHAEDIKVYNPDGKEIIARDNEKSILRKEKPEEAYYNCHTDITIPYDEVGLLSVVDHEGNSKDIIRDGLFVLDGLEELNKYLS